MSDEQERIISFVHQDVAEMERTGLELSAKHREINELREHFMVVEVEYDEAIAAALAAGWKHTDLFDLGISDEPRAYASRERARAKLAKEKAAAKA